MSKRNFFVRDSELDDYQVSVINKKTDKSFIVKGCAGSGKSILALWKAKQIQEENKGSFLYIVYTIALKTYMAEGIREIGISESNVDYFHHWFNNGQKSADYIIVDEAQDFTAEQINLFKIHARKALILYGDSAQQLYKFLNDGKTVSMEEIEYITGLKSEQLVLNHRLPKKIARLAEYFNSDEDELERRCKNEGIIKPKILEYNSLEEQYDAIANLILNKNMEDVGILFRYNNQVEAAYNYFRNNGLNVEAKFSKNNKTYTDLHFSSDNPKIMTYHSSKGLQFENVFLPACNSEDDKNALYVAITRSYNELYIMHSGDLSSFFDDIPVFLYDTSLSTGSKLQL